MAVVKRFRDFAKLENHNMPGGKVRMLDILGKEQIFLAYRIMKSKAVVDRDCLQLQFKETEDSPEKIVFTNSTVLIRQCRDYEKEFPFRASIVRHGRYYTFE